MTAPKLTWTALPSEAGPNLARLFRKAHEAHRKGTLGEAERLYKAVLAHAPDDFETLHLLGFLYYQRGRFDGALKFLTGAVRRNGNSAEARWNLGLVLHGLRRHGEALASYAAALALDPRNPDLLNVSAVALLDLDRPQDALARIDQALTIKPDHVEALGNRGNAFVRLNRPDDAIAAYDTALRICGNDARLLTNRAHALRRVDRGEDAIADLDRGIALCPDFAEAHFEHGMAKLALGDFESGWTAYERRWATAAFADRRRSFKSSAWTGKESVHGKTILVHAEQGFGDTIQFVRYVPMVARSGATVVLEVQPELFTLLSGAACAARVVVRGQKLPRFDLHCPLMSLPRAFETRVATIPADVPYIAPAETLASAWAHRLPAGRPLVGIAWAGHPSHRNDLSRSLPLGRLAPVLRDAAVQFVSLQCDLRGGDAAILDDLPNILDCGADLHDFADTAALLSRLDAVISVDTAVAHLAGAIGKPLILLLPYAADFRWLRGREDSPWYPTAKLLRQPKFGDWDSVVESLREELAALAPAERFG